MNLWLCLPGDACIVCGQPRGARPDMRLEPEEEKASWPSLVVTGRVSGTIMRLLRCVFDYLVHFHYHLKLHNTGTLEKHLM